MNQTDIWVKVLTLSAGFLQLGSCLCSGAKGNYRGEFRAVQGLFWKILQKFF